MDHVIGKLLIPFGENWSDDMHTQLLIPVCVCVCVYVSERDYKVTIVAIIVILHNY